MKRLKQIICLLLSLILVIGLLSGIEASALEETELELDESVTTEELTTEESTLDEDLYLASDQARGVVDVAVSREYLEIGATVFNLYWDYYGTGTWKVWQTYRQTVYALSYYPFKSGAIGYCIEPYSVNTAVGKDRYPISFDTIPVPWLSKGYTFEHEKQEGIALVMAYGAPNNGDTTEAGYYATAMLVWDMACGYRKVDGSLRFSDKPSPFYSRTESHIGYRDPEYWNEIDTRYQEILNCLAIHGTIPSFSARYAGQVSNAQTITLKYDSASGLYKGSATDKNKVLKNFNYVSTISGLTFSKSGNTLNITATAAAATKLANGVTIRARGNEVEVGPNSLALWGTSDDAQVMVTLNAPTDPVPSYFKLRADTTGTITGTKTTDTGTDLGGWEFQLLNGSTVVASTKSDSKGKFTFTSIPSGTYTLTEVVPSNSKYECTNNKQSVTVTVGKTTAVSFYNKQKPGKITFTKKTNTGKSLSGWEIKLYSDSSLKNLVGTYKTGSDGKVTTGNLTAGTYYAKETASTNSYWVSDTATKTITVTAGATATATFSNTHYGKLTFIKSTNTGNNLSGWEIKLYSDSALKNLVGTYKTGADGKVTTGNLTPGTYYAKETASTDPYWVCDAATKTVTVTAGATATATFSNNHYGKITFTKGTNTGNDLSGWEIKLYSDSALKNLVGTYKTDADGKVTTDNLTPGTYYAKETASTDPYWESDSEVKTIQVTVGKTVTASFSNTHYGKLKVIKSLETDGPLGGWQFKVTRLSDNTDMGILTSQEDGTILSENLLPGDYQVEEIIPDNSMFYCVTENPVTVTIKVGETAEVNFINTLRLRSGKIVIEKINLKGDHLAGAKFLLEWKNDEGIWEPVVFSEKEGIISGSCTSSGLADGTLVTDSTGIITFEGLHPGLEYRVTELEAPEGYQLLGDFAYEGQIPEDDLTAELTVVNSRGYHLPDTGISDSGGYVSIGSGTALAAFLALIVITTYCVFTGNKRREI